MPSADPVTEYNNNNDNDNNNVPAIEASDSYGIPQGDPFTEEEASAAPTGQNHNQYDLVKKDSRIIEEIFTTGYGIPLDDPVTTYDEPAVPASDSYGVINHHNVIV